MLLAFLKELMMKSSSVIYFNWFRLCGLSALINLAFLISLCNVVCTMLFTYFVCVIASLLEKIISLCNACACAFEIKSCLSHFLVRGGTRCNFHVYCVCAHGGVCVRVCIHV